MTMRQRLSALQRWVRRRRHADDGELGAQHADAPALPSAAPHAAGSAESALAEDAGVTHALTDLATSLAAVEKQIARMGREQLKANALAQTQTERWAETLETLRTADVQRTAEVTTLREQSAALVAEARRDVLQTLLPVLDSLDAALHSGTEILAQAQPVPRPTFWHRQPAAAGDVPLRESLHAWLAGLDLVRQRVLDVLAADGIVPIRAEGQPFDPYKHVAVTTVAADDEHPAGTVVRELRRGYRQHERIVRLAEVSVAKDARAAERIVS